MPSITYWNRLEPRPRRSSLERGLAAQVRDPLWFLTRQWQLGEFQGDDAASPAYVQLAARFAPLDGWQPAGGPARPYQRRAPLEAVVESEPFTPDYATAVELGQRFEAALAEAGLAALAPAFRAAYPISKPTDVPEAAQDRELARFLRVCAGRAVDGYALYSAARAAHPNPLPAPPLPPAHEAAVRDVLAAWLAWIQQVFGQVGLDDAPAWEPERLEYQVDVWASDPTDERARLRAYPGREGEFDWYAFDQAADQGTGFGDQPSDPTGEVQVLTRSLLPGHIRFRGMPNARWWQFEAGTTDFGAIQPDRRELGKLILMDFVLVHSNDWFTVPFTQPVGSLCRVDLLLVHDVFGNITVIERADHSPDGGPPPWSMFALSVEDEPAQLADFFILPPSAAGATQGGDIFEEARFLRDETANMVWAVEHLTENGLGAPWPGHERFSAGARLGQAAGGLRYQIQSAVPDHWIPFLPVQIDPVRRSIALERGAMLRPIPGGQPRPILPVGRILQPTQLPTTGVYRLREEEVPRSGVKVARLVRRSRWLDGSTHLWIARRKRTGTGEGSSGLRFDIAAS